MRPALAYDNALDLCSTDKTSLSIPSIDPEMVLKIPAAIDPVYAGPIALDAFLQYITDRLP